MKETNKSITTLTRDVHYLSQEMEDVLSNTNTLLDDINHKSEQLDPAVKAVADVSQSVSEVNASLQEWSRKPGCTARSDNLTGVFLSLQERRLF